MTQTIHTDVTICGGGVAGLWLLNRLRSLGYNAILLERDHLGDGQTIASQGMIHGGMKYALGGLLTNASEVIAGMPHRWRDCIRGRGAIDLTDVNLLSDHYYLWSASSPVSRLTAFLGSKAIRGRAAAVPRGRLPAVFKAPGFKGTVYRLNDLVLDTHSLISSLYQKQRDSIFQLDLSSSDNFLLNEDGSVAAIVAGGVSIEAKRFIFAAGKGNEQLLKQCRLDAPAMQKRPLHQVLVRHRYPHPVFAHSIDLRSGAKPRITITTHPAEDGYHVWYLGGALAENGVHREEGAQIDKAKKELKATLPWVDLPDAKWCTLRIDRAEPAQSEHDRPDTHYAKPTHNIIVAWPVKLTLAPALGDDVEALLQSQQILPGDPQVEEMNALKEALPGASPAEPFWNSVFQ